MNKATLHLISHNLCPYVQRAVIVLNEKGAPFERTYIDLKNSPEWFKKISPLGKVPLLQVGEEVLFESAAICEYLDETLGEPLHPGDPLQRAKHRAWMEFGSAILDTIWGFYTAPDAKVLEIKRADLQAKFETIEQQLKEEPYFAGERFSMVDVVFGPIFRYFDVFDTIADFGVFDNTPKARAWRSALAARSSVKEAVLPDYSARLLAFLKALVSELSGMIAMGGGDDLLFSARNKR
ncbi:MAG: glutathione S-transferase family protein [Gammaproteobacteria bacterium]